VKNKKEDQKSIKRSSLFQPIRVRCIQTAKQNSNQFLVTTRLAVTVLVSIRLVGGGGGGGTCNVLTCQSRVDESRCWPSKVPLMCVYKSLSVSAHAGDADSELVDDEDCCVGALPSVDAAIE
jgi:hypothetical protein